MTHQSLTLALERCMLQHEFVIEYYDIANCFCVVLHEPVLMHWMLERIMLLGGFLSIVAGFEREIHLIFDASAPL